MKKILPFLIGNMYILYLVTLIRINAVISFFNELWRTIKAKTVYCVKSLKLRFKVKKCKREMRTRYVYPKNYKL